MEDYKYSFTIEIAGVPVEVRCIYPENAAFFKDYIVGDVCDIGASGGVPPLTDEGVSGGVLPRTDKEASCGILPRTDEPKDSAVSFARDSEGGKTAFLVAPTKADRERIQSNFDEIARRDGTPAAAHSDLFLENNAIHSLLANGLVSRGVLLMHGSALCMDGAAYIFTAKSGTGKSTHARLWRETFGDRVWMINDDKPMLRFTDRGVEVCGTPWNGKHHLGRNASAPLSAIAWLTRDATNHVERMSPADAFPQLMRQCYFSREPLVSAKIVALEKRLLSETAFYKLSCNMEPEAAIVAWEGMSGMKFIKEDDL